MAGCTFTLVAEEYCTKRKREDANAWATATATRCEYHRGTHWWERVQMAQWWSDYLDKLRYTMNKAQSRRRLRLPNSAIAKHIVLNTAAIHIQDYQRLETTVIPSVSFTGALQEQN